MSWYHAVGEANYILYRPIIVICV